jgi:ATP adenylyltransferase
MEKLYAPWRSDYVTGTVHKEKREKLKNDCVFCTAFQENNDEKYFILKRYKHCIVMLNAYPYNAGHLLILPIEHKGELDDLSINTRNELMDIINLSINALTKILKPQGFNVGLNLGIAGGGGIPSHLHFHILPRWSGDTNYLATIGEVKVVSSDLFKIYKDLKKEF